MASDGDRWCIAELVRNIALGIVPHASTSIKSYGESAVGGAVEAFAQRYRVIAQRRRRKALASALQ